MIRLNLSISLMVGKNGYFCTLYQLIDVVGIIPQMVLVYLNIRILLTMRKLRQRLRTSQQSKDDNLAFILISTVIMFFFCHLPRYQIIN